MWKRWYDKYPVLSKYLDTFQAMHYKTRDKLVKGILELIEDNNSGYIMENFILDFPLDIYRKRWYDKDPYLWLIFNSLKYADEVLIEKVTKYLKQNVKLKKKGK